MTQASSKLTPLRFVDCQLVMSHPSKLVDLDLVLSLRFALLLPLGDANLLLQFPSVIGSVRKFCDPVRSFLLFSLYHIYRLMSPSL